MNDDARVIKAALDRRFARAATPPCPDGAWQAATAAPVRSDRPRGLPRGFAYAAALLAVVGIGGLAAQAANPDKLHDLPFMRFFVSSKPLMPGIHAADRLTIAEAQRRISFPIVVPTGLPEGTRFQYAHVIKEQPNPLVGLTYQAHIANKYYRIAFNESTVSAGPPSVHVQMRSSGHGTKSWDFPVRQFKHGDVFIDLLAFGLPEDLSDRIVRANTL
ncbi:MAG: hypothetical protein M3N49_00215 [Candidatus Eremiobacteraeota bacterium]|nr:hypothetical protein [Candidatus Eremiobacteraeota bacterium]